jgi:hypothetical protein
MIEELNTPKQDLAKALDKYTMLCSSIQNSLSFLGAPQEQSLQQMDNELDLLASYERKLQEARSSISKAQNNSFNLILINSFPSEILLYIFQLVMGPKPCQFSLDPFACIVGPDCLSQICSRWQNVAILSPTLRTHLDFAPRRYESLKRVGIIMNQVSTCATRSNGLPVQIHVTEPGIISS